MFKRILYKLGLVTWKEWKQIKAFIRFTFNELIASCEFCEVQGLRTKENCDNCLNNCINKTDAKNNICRCFDKLTVLRRIIHEKGDIEVKAEC